MYIYPKPVLYVLYCILDFLDLLCVNFFRLKFFIFYLQVCFIVL